MPSDVLCLCYHAISARWPSPLAVSPDALHDQVAGLMAAGYRSVTLTQALTDGGGRERLLAITFDDAYASVLQRGMPVLSSLGAVGTVFVPTAFAGRPAPMRWAGIEQWTASPHAAELVPCTWDALRRAQADGWEVGSHTRTHARLTTLTDPDLEEELAGSLAACRQQLGRQDVTIAYPYGAVDRRVAATARDVGYLAGVALSPRLVPWPHASDTVATMSCPRIGVYPADTPRRFALKTSRTLRRLRASGAGPAVERGRRMIAR